MKFHLEKSFSALLLWGPMVGDDHGERRKLFRASIAAVSTAFVSD
jgi:hypothetical protein